jgi:hypothetical protein
MRKIAISSALLKKRLFKKNMKNRKGSKGKKWNAEWKRQPLIKKMLNC